MYRYLVYFLFSFLCFIPAATIAGNLGSPLSEFSGNLAPMTEQLQQDVDSVIPQIRGFDEVYDVDATDKTYVGTRIQWQTLDMTQAMIWSPQRDWDDLQIFNALMLAHQHNSRIDKIINQYTWYVSDRYIDNYGNCARQNFMRAFDEFGTIILQPGQTLNINKLLA